MIRGSGKTAPLQQCRSLVIEFFAVQPVAMTSSLIVLPDVRNPIVSICLSVIFLLEYVAVSIFFRRIKKASSVTVLFRTQGNEPVVFQIL